MTTSRGSTMTLSFPPFRGFVRAVVVACTAVYFVMLVLHWAAPGIEADANVLFSLIPVTVMRGWVWQLVTYSFLHAGVTHILVNMLALWMVGAYLEVAIGTRKVAEIYFVSVIGAALSTVALAYGGWYFLSADTATKLGLLPSIPAVGASGGIFGLMMAFAVLFGDMEFMMFPLPFRIKAKWMVTIYILLALAGLLGGGTGVANAAHLGGALFGYLYIKLAPRNGVGFRTSEMYFGVRNRYYRWKRQRAQKKFQVYMKKSNGTSGPNGKPNGKPNGHA
jgi:membrane associated rhomboid family serine protease